VFSPAVKTLVRMKNKSTLLLPGEEAKDLIKFSD